METDGTKDGDVDHRETGKDDDGDVIIDSRNVLLIS